LSHIEKIIVVFVVLNGVAGGGGSAGSRTVCTVLYRVQVARWKVVIEVWKEDYFDSEKM